MKKKILFVCTGNTCRSPMAEHLFRKLLLDHKKDHVESDSAGISPSLNREFPKEASEVLAEEGVTDVQHKSKGLSEKMLSESEWVLVMEEQHKEFLLAQFPQVQEKVYLLKKFSGLIDDHPGIDDPFGHGLEAYKKALSEIKSALEKLIQKI